MFTAGQLGGACHCPGVTITQGFPVLLKNVKGKAGGNELRT